MTGAAPFRLYRITIRNAARPSEPAETYTDRFKDEAQARDLLRRRGWAVEAISELPVDDDPLVRPNSGTDAPAQLDDASIAILSICVVIVALAISAYGAWITLASLFAISMAGWARWRGMFLQGVGMIAYALVSLIIFAWALARLAKSNRKSPPPSPGRFVAFSCSLVLLGVILLANLPLH